MLIETVESKQDLLGSLQIAAPCDVSWESMTGNDRVRNCEQCSKNVYNISSMTKIEANEFLQATAFTACVNFYQRSDGTILTDNCPVGLRKIRAQYRKMATAAGTIISLASGVLLSVFAGDQGLDKSTNKIPASIKGKILRGEPAAPRRLGGEPTELGGKPMSGAPAPIDRTGGLPPPPIKSNSTEVYGLNIKPLIAAVMPKGDLGRAAISLSIKSDGHVQGAKLISSSPSKKTDELIIKSVSKLKLPALPDDYHQPVLIFYYECQQSNR